ncbi:MAG: Nif11-like leader peptide family natural product precursor [Simkania sp.]|nr:Nif11-like leader peptide family natural product precursor [Simkania sp.]MCP5490215.1 Nif11-like leader peptide family natural product precursor [Chlamydiales bacterium]
MSKQNAKQFLDRVETDANFRNQFLSAKKTDQKEKILKNEHYSFSKKELQEAINEKWGSNLTPEEMKKIAAAGGGGPCSNPESMKVISALVNCCVCKEQ